MVFVVSFEHFMTLRRTVCGGGGGGVEDYLYLNNIGTGLTYTSGRMVGDRNMP